MWYKIKLCSFKLDKMLFKTPLAVQRAQGFGKKDTGFHPPKELYW